MAVQCVLVGKGKDDVFTAIYGETTFDEVLKAQEEGKIIQVIQGNHTFYFMYKLNFMIIFGCLDSSTYQSIRLLSDTSFGTNGWVGPVNTNFTPATHAKTHAKDGTDPLSPADIGAMELSENVLKQSNEDITSQVAQALSGDLVPFSGGTMTGLLNVLTPISDSNATTKKYVDDALKKKIEMDSIGDLHVWRKTVTTAAEIPAGYTLGDVQEVVLGTASTAYGIQNETRVSMYAATSITILDNGHVNLVSPTDCYGYVHAAKDGTIATIVGKFFYIYQLGSYVTAGDAAIGDVYFVPSDAEITCTNYSTRVLSISKAQKVNAYPLTPAGTTTTYPVSTNPNAWQEGDDAKAAGYVVGDVVTGKFLTGGSTSVQKVYWNCASAVKVSDDGTLTLVSPTTYQIHADNKSATNALPGKFAVVTNGENYISGSPFVQKRVVYIPSDAVVNTSTMSIDRYQPVTGYPAIPAGTTIEYLGKLGDKARVQVVSYIGTGTYGQSNKNKLTFSEKPLFVIVPGAPFGYAYIPDGNFYYALPYNYVTLEDLNCIWDDATNTMTWYHSSYADRQYNTNKRKYMFIAVY